MKKRILTLVAVMLMAVVPAMSQVFMTDEDAWENLRVPTEEPNLGVMVPLQDVEYDQYIPLSGGMYVLAGLGAAYLLGKKRKDKE